MYPQQTQNICRTFIQCRPNVFDVGPTLYESYTNVLCLLGLAHNKSPLTTWAGCRVVLSEAVDGCICFIRKIPHGGDWERSRPQGPKNVHNFSLTVRPLSWACGHGTEMLLILKKTIFDLITPRYFPIWQSKEMSHDFVRSQSVANGREP